MKCLLVLIARCLQPGASDSPGEPAALSQSEIVRLTGLNRRSVYTAIQFLEAKGWIKSSQIGNSVIYTLKIERELRELNRKESSISLDSLNGYEKKFPIDRAEFPIPGIHKKLLSSGIYASVISELLHAYPAEKIERHYAYYEYALSKGFARSPGWLVSSLRQDWPPPPGYQDPDPAARYRNSKYRQFYANFDDDE